MISKKKKAVFILLFIALVSGFLLLLNYLASTFINRASVKTEIGEVFSRQTGGTLAYRSVDLSWFPSVHAVIHNVNISLPGKVQASVRTLQVYPEILPLFRRKLVIRKLRIGSPEVAIMMPVHADEGGTEVPLTNRIRNNVTSALAAIVRSMPDLSMELKDGSLRLSKAGQDVLSVNNFRSALVVDNASSRIRLNIEGTDVDVASLRAAALTWKDDLPAAKDIFSVLRGGKIPRISYQAEATSFQDLVNAKYFVIRGEMEKGRLFIPGPDLNLEDVSGSAIIADSVLTGKVLAARSDGATARDGILTLGLTGGNRPFHLDIHMETDLSKLQPILKKVITHTGFLNEIRQLHNIKGGAAGRLDLGGNLNSVEVGLAVSDLNMSAEYDRLPYPFKIHGGKLSYNKAMILIQNMSGELGGSSFSDVDAELTLDKGHLLTISSASSNLLMDEIHPWVMSYENIRNHIKNLGKVKGRIDVNSLRLEGPLMKPGEWDLDGMGRVTSLTIFTPLLPDQLDVDDGKFEITQDMLSLTESHIRTGDAVLNLSGVIESYLGEQKKADLIFYGEAGPGAVEWVSRIAGLPGELVPRSPMSVSNARLTRNRDRKTSFAGDLAVANGPGIFLDITESPDEIVIRKLAVKDDESDATLALTLNEQEISVDYAGKLSPRTIEHLFDSPLVKRQMIEGDFHTLIKRDMPVQFTARGSLSAEDVYLPLTDDVTSGIERLTVEAAGDRIKISNAGLILDGEHITAKGTVTSSDRGVRFALDASSDGIKWDSLGKFIDSGLPERKRKFVSDIIESGTIDFDAGFFSYDDHSLKPFRGKLTLSGNNVHIDVTEAELCSISITGDVDIDPPDMSVDMHPRAGRQELKSAIACLFNIQQYMTGTYDLDGRISGKGKKDALTDDLTGQWKFTADSGRIHQYSLTAKVLAFINLTEIFRGQAPDFLHEGFAYNTITADGEIKGSNLVLTGFVIDGASMKIAIQGTINYLSRATDLKVLVSPLKTVDFIIEKIPVIGHIFGGNLISIPVRVTGDFKDPDMSYMNPADIGSGLIEIMKNSLNLPGKILEPLIPEEQKPGK